MRPEACQKIRDGAGCGSCLTLVLAHKRHANSFRRGCSEARTSGCYVPVNMLIDEVCVSSMV